MHNHTVDIEKAKDILRQASDLLEIELATLGFSVVGQVHGSDAPPYTTTMLFSASLQFDGGVGDYTLLPYTKLSGCVHEWVEDEDGDGPYDRCEKCGEVEYL